MNTNEEEIQYDKEFIGKIIDKMEKFRKELKNLLNNSIMDNTEIQNKSLKLQKELDAIILELWDEYENFVDAEIDEMIKTGKRPDEDEENE